jgi:hypothetical protein
MTTNYTTSKTCDAPACPAMALVTVGRIVGPSGLGQTVHTLDFCGHHVYAYAAELDVQGFRTVPTELVPA